MPIDNDENCPPNLDLAAYGYLKPHGIWIVILFLHFPPSLLSFLRCWVLSVGAQEYKASIIPLNYIYIMASSSVFLWDSWVCKPVGLWFVCLLLEPFLSICLFQLPYYSFCFLSLFYFAVLYQDPLEAFSNERQKWDGWEWEVSREGAGTVEEGN